MVKAVFRVLPMAVVFLTCAMLILPNAARAQTMLEVISSTEPSIQVGMKVRTDHVFNVPKGKQVQLLKTPNRTTHVIKGAHTGTLQAYEKSRKRTWYERLFGKSDAKEPPVGGTRGLR